MKKLFSLSIFAILIASMSFAQSQSLTMIPLGISNVEDTTSDIAVKINVSQLDSVEYYAKDSIPGNLAQVVSDTFGIVMVGLDTLQLSMTGLQDDTYQYAQMCALVRDSVGNVTQETCSQWYPFMTEPAGTFGTCTNVALVEPYLNSLDLSMDFFNGNDTTDYTANVGLQPAGPFNLTSVTLAQAESFGTDTFSVNGLALGTDYYIQVESSNSSGIAGPFPDVLQSYGPFTTLAFQDFSVVDITVDSSAFSADMAQAAASFALGSLDSAFVSLTTYDNLGLYVDGTGLLMIYSDTVVTVPVSGLNPLQSGYETVATIQLGLAIDELSVIFSAENVDPPSGVYNSYTGGSEIVATVVVSSNGSFLLSETNVEMEWIPNNSLYPNLTTNVSGITTQDSLITLALYDVPGGQIGTITIKAINSAGDTTIYANSIETDDIEVMLVSTTQPVEIAGGMIMLDVTVIGNGNPEVETRVVPVDNGTANMSLRFDTITGPSTTTFTVVVGPFDECHSITFEADASDIDGVAPWHSSATAYMGNLDAVDMDCSSGIEENFWSDFRVTSNYVVLPSSTSQGIIALTDMSGRTVEYQQTSGGRVAFSRLLTKGAYIVTFVAESGETFSRKFGLGF